MELGSLTIAQLLDGYRKKKFLPSEVTLRLLEKIKEKDKELGSFLEVQPDRALANAKAWDNRLHEIDKYPLFGIPVAIKDNFLVKGWRATAGSKILENYVCPYTATSVEKMVQAGAIVIGKTNCDEFAMGSSNENSAFYPAKNPWDKSRVPGGSSGGSAVAVATGFSLASLGTETGGSVRQPASLCGVVGIKPSYGRVSRYGIVAFGSSLDQVGPFGKTVWDAARVLEVISGHDVKDATSSTSNVPSYATELREGSLKGAVFGITKALLQGVENDVAAAFNMSVKLLQDAGAKVIEVELPHTKYSLSTYYLIASSEASSNLARYDGVHYGCRSVDSALIDDVYYQSRGKGFGAEVRLRIMLGTYALSAGYYDAYYLKANRVRRLIQKDFEDVFEKCQCILTPTSPTTAFKLGEKSDDPITMYLSDIFTLPVNLAGITGVSIPCGLDKQQLPIGLQFIGKAFDEKNILNLCHGFEKVRGGFPAPPGY